MKPNKTWIQIKLNEVKWNQMISNQDQSNLDVLLISQSCPIACSKVKNLTNLDYREQGHFTWLHLNFMSAIKDSHKRFTCLTSMPNVHWTSHEKTVILVAPPPFAVQWFLPSLESFPMVFVNKEAVESKPSSISLSNLESRKYVKTFLTKIKIKESKLAQSWLGTSC